MVWLLVHRPSGLTPQCIFQVEGENDKTRDETASMPKKTADACHALSTLQFVSLPDG